MCDAVYKLLQRGRTGRFEPGELRTSFLIVGRNDETVQNVWSNWWEKGEHCLHIRIVKINLLNQLIEVLTKPMK